MDGVVGGLEGEDIGEVDGFWVKSGIGNNSFKFRSRFSAKGFEEDGFLVAGGFTDYG